jgi:hypothetical protein
MKNGSFLKALAVITLLSVSAYAEVDVFNEFGGEAKSWLTGQLGYLVALFAFMGSVIIYAFTHKHTILFIGFIIAFLAGAGPTLAGLSHTMGTGMEKCSHYNGNKTGCEGSPVGCTWNEDESTCSASS